MSRRKNKPQIIRELPITAWAAEGKSLGRTEGKVVFVEKTVPGDVVDVFLTRNKKDWAEGHAIHFHAQSPQRVEPFCEHFGVCGGCQWQMLPYQQQLEYKQQQVYDQLTRIGLVEPEKFLPIAGCDRTREYRNKIEFAFANKRYLLPHEVKDPNVQAYGAFAGFHARGIFDKVVNINRCHLMEEPVNLVRETLKLKALELGLEFYDIRKHTGYMRGVQYRLCTTGELMINLMVASDESELLKQLLDHLLHQVPQITTLYYTINTKMNDSLTGLEPQLYFGKPHVTEVLGDCRFLIGPKSFFQTNSYQAAELYRIAMEMAELSGSETLYDLYCGTGSIGLFMHKKVARIVGVELVEEAIADARMNAKMNEVAHASFYAGDVIEVCDDAFFEAHGRPDVIITDPPRAGMHEKLVNKLLEISAPLIVYVSCNPATQARDLKLLAAKYEVTKLQPVDMFPHTQHIETVAQLRLKI